MKTLALILALAAAWPVVAQTTYKINQLTELAAAPADTDWLMIWDTSAATSKKISRANFLAGGIIPESFGLTDPGADRLLFWDESAGVYRHLTLGTGLSISDTTLNAETASATVTLPAARIAYGAADNTLTNEAGFEYDATFNNLRVPTMVSIGATGSAFAMYTTGSGSLTMFNDFTDETLIWNLGVGGANTAFLSSDSGVTLLELTSIDLKVPTEVYDATGWNGDLTVPTKDAIRDKIEAVVAGSAGLTATYVGYGDGSNNLTGEAAFTYNATTNTLTAANIAATALTTTDLNVTNLNADLLNFIEEEGSGTDSIELYIQSAITADRRLGFAMPDSDTEITFPASIITAGVNYANAWSDGIKQTFNPNGTTAGINVGSHTADPSSPANGDLWYDSTANELTARINGSNVALGAGGGGGSVATDTIFDAKGDLAVGTGSNTSSKLAVGTNGYVLTADSAEATGLKWAAASGSGPSISAFKQNVFLWDDFLMNGNFNTTYNAVGPFGLKGTLSPGASASQQQSVLTTAFGMVRLETGATGTPAAGLGTAATSILFNATQAASYNFETRIVTGSSISNCEIRVGFLDSVTSTEPTDGVYFRYSAADASWVCVCRSNGTETGTALDSAIDVATSTSYVLRITVNAAGTSAGFYINGTQVTGSPLSSNIPGGSTSRVTGIGWSIYSSEAVTKQIDLDYAGLEVSYSSSR